MRKFSILSAIAIAAIFSMIGLSSISVANKCTSVRTYSCKKGGVSTDSAGQIPTEAYDLASNPDLVKVLLDTSKVYALEHDTKFSYVIESEKTFDVYYSGKDNLIVSISKTSYWVIGVTVNGKKLSREEIDKVYK